MSRRGPELTREHADKIVKKLKARVEKGLRSGHDIATIYYEEEPVLSFGIRRASNKDTGHGHLTEDLFLPASQVKRLANCPMTIEEWVARMKEKRVIVEKDNEVES
jgi:hypothetical protein